MSPTDHSDRIAYVHCLIQLLTEWEPAGDWQQDEILTAWRADRYGLSVGQFDALEEFLENQHQRAAMALVRRETLKYGMVGGQHG
jgi:hypothetical protein